LNFILSFWRAIMLNNENNIYGAFTISFFREEVNFPKSYLLLFSALSRRSD